MILLVVFAVIAIAVAVRLAVPFARRRRMAAELRGDWWPRFEQEFRCYSERRFQAARKAEHGA